ncbi:MAG: hypothetical protein ACYTXC_06460 [Nostoc sp.]
MSSNNAAILDIVADSLEAKIALFDFEYLPDFGCNLIHASLLEY